MKQTQCFSFLFLILTRGDFLIAFREKGREGGREGEREGGREGGKEGGREGGERERERERERKRERERENENGFILYLGLPHTRVNTKPYETRNLTKRMAVLCEMGQ